MLTTTSSSPSLNPIHPYLSPRSRANTSSPRPRTKKAPPNSPHFPSPSQTSSIEAAIPPPQSAPPKPETVDQGTQYSPPDWPPTSSRSSLRKIPTTDLAPAPDVSPTFEKPNEDIATSATLPKVADPEPPVECEPQLRVTSSISHQTVQGSARRSRSSPSETTSVSPSSKRARAQNPNVTVLPACYTKCDAKQLAIVIADMLMELIRINDDIPLGNNHLTRFHSRAPPGISVHDYLIRLTFHATLSPPILLSMVYYIDKLCDLYPSFRINSLTVHRFLITAVTVASKGLSDSFWTNSTYARVGGVNLKELALLELEFLTRMQWEIIPKPAKLVEYYMDLVDRNESYVIEEDDKREEMKKTMDPEDEPGDGLIHNSIVLRKQGSNEDAGTEHTVAAAADRMETSSSSSEAGG